MKGRVVVITGAAGGQGAAEVAAAVAAGAVVHAVDREPGPAAPGTVRHVMDVADADAWAALADRLEREHGAVHGLVANAGITWRARLDELDPADRAANIAETALTHPAGSASSAGCRPPVLGRTGTAAEVASVVLFLLGDGASFVTGAEIAVDGGLTAHGGVMSISAATRPARAAP